jgi:hypothetical protein
MHLNYRNYILCYVGRGKNNVYKSLSFLAAVNMAGCIRDISIGGTTRTIINFMLFLH